MAANTSSTTAVDGSADEFVPAPKYPPPRTPAQLAADAALADQRISVFTSDTFLYIVSPPPYNNTSTSRTQAAASNIAAFDAAFDKNDNHNIVKK
ncbi:hypothetical protein DL98DRAFT_598140 [Cadophora sp. DSE1049]|nr:hypothetical protein DL98DRAFT_598140 [Cadophora sp. DSE1049]